MLLKKQKKRGGIGRRKIRKGVELGKERLRRVGKGLCEEPGRAERARMGSSGRKRAEAGILEPTGGYLIPPLDHRAQQAGSVIEGRRRIQEKTGDGSLIPHLPVDPCRTREECLT